MDVHASRNRFFLHMGTPNCGCPLNRTLTSTRMFQLVRVDKNLIEEVVMMMQYVFR